MVVLICKNEEDPIKNEGARMATRLYVDFSDAQAQLTVSGWIWQKFKLIQAFMHVLATSKNDEVPIKNECATVATKFLPL